VDGQSGRDWRALTREWAYVLQSLYFRCQASSTSAREPYNLCQISSVPEGTPAMIAMTGAVNALFSFKPFFKFASGQARKIIIERGTEIGYPWAPELARLREYNWDAELKAVQNLDIEYPEVGFSILFSPLPLFPIFNLFIILI
jgi:hypothetical protein